MFNEVTEVKCDWQGHSPPTQSQSKTPHDVLDHSSQPRWEEQSDRPQNAHQHKHPEEYSINHHGNIFPVFPHLVGKKKRFIRFRYHDIFSTHVFPSQNWFFGWLLSCETTVFSGICSIARTVIKKIIPSKTSSKCLRRTWESLAKEESKVLIACKHFLNPGYSF